MRKILSILALCLLTSCITIETKTPPPPHFVTSTLPALPAASSTPSATALPAVATLPRPANCKEAALLIMDVNFPDGTRVEAGQTFTKTWRLRNTGTCPWDMHYTLAFVRGERMGAPDSVPMQVTAPKADTDISVELTAPAANGSYSGFFELRDPSGQVIPIGLERSIWVKITVGAGAPAVPSVVEATSASVVVTPVVTLAITANVCAVDANPGYVNQLLGLINAARRSANLPALTLNDQLTAAAQAHSADMACNNFLGHTGSNGSDIGSRIRAAGYFPTHYVEIIAIGTPQDAINQWQASASHWDAVLNASVTEVGIGYAYYAQSDYGGYITVDFGAR